MPSVVKRVLVLSMLVLIATPVLFSFTLLMQQQLIKYRMGERVEQSCFQTITLKTSDIRWVDDGEELLVDNKLFDVKFYQKTEGQTTFTGVFDEEEDAVVAKLNDSFQEKKKSNDLLMAKFIAEQVLSNDETLFTIQNTWKIINQKYPTFLQAIPQTTSRITFPPPKFS